MLPTLAPNPWVQEIIRSQAQVLGLGVYTTLSDLESHISKAGAAHTHIHTPAQHTSFRYSIGRP